jgi:poly-gamma-glutamate capsule biosynthesis protein CapA/YwtB (metallophosphatase superfamily)
MNRWIAGSAVLWSSLGFAGWQLARVLDHPKSTPIKLDYAGLMEPARPAQLAGWNHRDESSVKLLFAGDIMQHDNQRNDDFAATYAGVKPLVQKADLAAGNLEFPVNPAAPLGPQMGTVVFNGSAQQVKALAAAGFDLMSTANNHQFDQGIEGAESTLRAIGETGMKAVGSAPKGSPVEVRTLPAGGARIAFAAYTYPPNIYPQEGKTYTLWSRDWPANELNFNDWSGSYREKGLRFFARDVAAARAAGADFVVALVHWGKEWTFQPTEDQRRAAHDLIDAGFDLVVGGHAHVVSPPEVYRGKLIAYSLGNLVSDFVPMEARLGALLEVKLVKPADDGRLEAADFVYYPVLTDRSAANHPVKLLRPGDSGEAAEARSLAQRVLGNLAVDR